MCVASIYIIIVMLAVQLITEEWHLEYTRNILYAILKYAFIILYNVDIAHHTSIATELGPIAMQKHKYTYSLLCVDTASCELEHFLFDNKLCIEHLNLEELLYSLIMSAVGRPPHLLKTISVLSAGFYVKLYIARDCFLAIRERRGSRMAPEQSTSTLLLLKLDIKYK